MPDNQQRLETVAKAEDTSHLLEDIAWTAVIKPALMKERNSLSTLLVNTVLGAAAPVVNGVQPLSKEQLAGYIYGIDAIIRVFEKILTNGQHALQQLEQQGFHLTAVSKAVSNSL